MRSRDRDRVLFSIADLVAVTLVDMVMSKLGRSNAAQRAMQRAGGAILVGLGAHGAFQTVRPVAAGAGARFMVVYDPFD